MDPGAQIPVRAGVIVNRPSLSLPASETVVCLYWTVKVTVLLFTPAKLAVTLMLVPVVALAESVPVPLPFVRVRAVVLELTQVTEEVISCCVLLPGKVATALKVIVVLAGGVAVDAVSMICVGVPALTVTIVVAALTVPEEALMVVLQTPETFETGETRPLALTVAQLVVDELHRAWPVRFLVVPSL